MNLDSLMDTLTNVVGILVIILIFTVLGGADAVKRVKNFVDEITEAQLKKSQEKSDELRQLLEENRELLASKELTNPSEPVNIEEARKAAEQLKAELEKLSQSQIDPEALAKLIAERQKRKDELDSQLATQQEEIAKLKARLADTVAAGGDQDAKIVNLPDPKSAPEQATPLTYLCRGNQIVPLDTPGLQAKAIDVVRATARTVIRENRVDAEKLADIFEKKFVGDRYCQLKIRVGGDARPYLAVFPRADTGISLEELQKTPSPFGRVLRDVNRQGQFLDFRVWSDSFDAYLEARNAAAKRGILAGWIPYPEKAEYWIAFPSDFKLLCLGKEPPAPSTAPAGPPKPPPPPDVVD